MVLAPVGASIVVALAGAHADTLDDRRQPRRNESRAAKRGRVRCCDTSKCQFVVAVDRFRPISYRIRACLYGGFGGCILRSVAENMRSLALAIEGMRQVERHGGGFMLERAFTCFLAIAPPTGKTMV
jgi:hypothetical protein